jgi:hypothetical protein
MEANVASQRPFREKAISKIRAIVSGLWPQVIGFYGLSFSDVFWNQGSRGSFWKLRYRFVSSEFRH